jgi:hypothetical protein
VSPGPVLEESLPAVVVLVEHPASPGPLLEESFPAVVVFIITVVNQKKHYINNIHA